MTAIVVGAAVGAVDAVVGAVDAVVGAVDAVVGAVDAVVGAVVPGSVIETSGGVGGSFGPEGSTPSDRCGGIYPQ